MPISEPSPIVQPCEHHRWPTVTRSPSVVGKPRRRGRRCRPARSSARPMRQEFAVTAQHRAEPDVGIVVELDVAASRCALSATQAVGVRCAAWRRRAGRWPSSDSEAGRRAIASAAVPVAALRRKIGRVAPPGMASQLRTHQDPAAESPREPGRARAARGANDEGRPRRAWSSSPRRPASARPQRWPA